MKLNLDKSSDIPIYLQIVEHILEMIRSGELVNGEKLPTERELKNEYQISVGTVKSAYKMLAQMNKVVSVQGSGTYVTRMQTELEMAHLRSGVDQLLFHAFSAEISEEQIRDRSNKCRNGFSEIHDNPDFHRLDAPYQSRPEL